MSLFRLGNQLLRIAGQLARDIACCCGGAPVTGACCLGCHCTDSLTESQCTALGGVFKGVGTPCDYTLGSCTCLSEPNCDAVTCCAPTPGLGYGATCYYDFGGFPISTCQCEASVAEGGLGGRVVTTECTQDIDFECCNVGGVAGQYAWGISSCECETGGGEYNVIVAGSCCIDGQCYDGDPGGSSPGVWTRCYCENVMGGTWNATSCAQDPCACGGTFEIGCCEACCTDCDNLDFCDDPAFIAWVAPYLPCTTIIRFGTDQPCTGCA